MRRENNLTWNHVFVQEDGVGRGEVDDSSFVVDSEIKVTQVFTITRCLNEKSRRTLYITCYWIGTLRSLPQWTNGSCSRI